MRIAVIGAGGVGGAFGAALAKAGSDVTFVARGRHLAAMRTRGLSVPGPRGDIPKDTLPLWRRADARHDPRQGDGEQAWPNLGIIWPNRVSTVV